MSTADVQERNESLREQAAQVDRTVQELRKVADRLDYVANHWDAPTITKRGPRHA